MKKGVILFFILILLISYFLIRFYSEGSDEGSSYSNENREEINEEESSVEEEHWKRVFGKAFEPVDCPPVRDPASLPNGYYKGPMIDTHIHLQSLPDGEPGHPDEFYTGSNLGIEYSISQWICMMNVEGTKQAFGFFPVWEPIIDESIQVVEIVEEKYPDRFIPFIAPSDRESPTVNAQKLQEMLPIKQGLFKGYGEIGLYGDEQNNNFGELLPDSQKLMEIYPIIEKNNLIVYFHLGVGQKESFERAVKAFPNITFIFHGDQLKDCADCDKTHSQISEILERHSNVYYGIDELYGGEWLIKPGETKENFLNHFKNYDALLERDLATFKEFIESHPDQVLFGTDRGASESWDTDPEVALTLNNYTRYFIGHLDEAVQEKIAYKNAERLLEG